MKLDWVPARLDRLETPAFKASLIFVNGHGRFTAGRNEALLLKRFLARRGTLVAEGCCGSEVFVDSFQEFIRTELYPELRVKFREITVAHPVCHQKHDLSPADISALEMKTGCHKRRILILKRDISCALNGKPQSGAELERARKVAVNLLEWAVRAKSPQGKLAAIDVREDDGGILSADELYGEPAGATRRYRQPFGRLIHRGEWDVDLGLFPTLRRAVATYPFVPRFDGEVFIDPRSDDLFATAVLYITGHGDPRLRREEWLPLREYIGNGGRVVACACCGLEEFDRGFRRLLRQVLPNDRLEEIPADDPLWRAPYARKALEAKGTSAYHRKYGGQLAPLLGIRREGRWIVLYSPVDICCDLEGDLDDETVGYRKETAVPIWVNLLHYLATP
jgi:hypothetical protein